MSSAYNPLPPFHTHTFARLTHAQAHTFLSSFLTQADSNPAYRPDATLTDRGPVSTSTGTAAAGAATSSLGGNLTLSNLRRVLLGMEGRRVGGAQFMATSGAGGIDEQVDERPRKRVRREVEVDAQGEVVLEENTDYNYNEEGQQGQDEWQEKDDYELEQDEILAVDAENEDEAQPAVGENSTSGNVLSRREEVQVKKVAMPASRGDVSIPRRQTAEEATADTNTLSKADRKKAKRQRMDEEKKVREKERQAAKSKA